MNAKPNISNWQITSIKSMEHHNAYKVVMRLIQIDKLKQSSVVVVEEAANEAELLLQT